MHVKNRPFYTGKLLPVYTLLLLLTAGCRNSEERIATVSGCDSSILKRYKDAVNAAGDHAGNKADTIMAFYERNAYPCRELTATPVILDLFDIIYTDHREDTAVLPFLNRIADDAMLSAGRRAEAMLNIAAYYLYGLQDADQALIHLQKADLMSRGTNDTENYKGYHAMMGEYMMQKSRLKEAAACYLHIIHLCELQRDSSGLAANLGNYASVYTALKDYAKAIEIKKKAAGYFSRTKQYQNLLIGYAGIGKSYVDMQQNDSAIAYFRRALSLITEGRVYSPATEFNIHINLGAVAMGQKDYHKARECYASAKVLLDSLRDPYRERFYLMAATPAFADIRDVSSEIDTIQKMLRYFYRNEDLASAQNAAYAIFQAYSLRKNFHSAIDHFVEYDSIKNILTQQENRDYITEIETSYESQKKELNIQLQQEELRRKQLFSWLLLAALILVVLSTGVILSRILLGRRKKETRLHRQFTLKLMNNTEEERARVARDLHDSVSQELLLLKRQLQDERQHLSEKIDTIIQDVRMISRDLHPVILEKAGLAGSVTHLCDQLMESGALFATADISYEKGLDKHSELQLYRMIQETLNNATGYAGAEAARVTITEKHGLITTEIKYNGKRPDVKANSEEEPGHLLNLAGRSRAMGGNATFSSSSTGIIVKIEIPKRK